MSAEHTHDEHAAEHEGMTKKKIWQVFFYLLGITAVEFFIALYMIPKGLIGHGIGNFAYIVLTLVKAFDKRKNHIISFPLKKFWFC